MTLRLLAAHGPGEHRMPVGRTAPTPCTQPTPPSPATRAPARRRADHSYAAMMWRPPSVERHVEAVRVRRIPSPPLQLHSRTLADVQSRRGFVVNVLGFAPVAIGHTLAGPNSFRDFASARCRSRRFSDGCAEYHRRSRSSAITLPRACDRPCTTRGDRLGCRLLGVELVEGFNVTALLAALHTADRTKRV